MITERDSKKRHIIRAVYEDNDILRREGEKPVIAKPRKHLKPEMSMVWEEIENFIKQEEKVESFKTLIVKLISPPYGMRFASIPLVLAAVIRKPYLDGCLSIKKRLQFFNEITADLVEDIVKSPDLFQPAYKELTSTRKAILNGISDVFGREELDVNGLKNIIIRWWQSVPLHCRMHTQKHISPESISLRKDVFDALVKLESDPNEILIEKLAEKLGIEFTQKTSVEIREYVHKKLSKVKEEYESCLEKLVRKLENILQSIFKDIKEWYQSLPEESRNYRSYQPEQVNKFLSALETYVNGNIDTEVFIKELPKAICIPLENWNDEEIISFKTKLIDYKEIVEKYRPPKQEGSVIPTTLSPEEAEILFQLGSGVKKRRFKLRPIEEIRNDPMKKPYVQWLEQSLNNFFEANTYFSEDELYSVIYQILVKKI